MGGANGGGRPRPVGACWVAAALAASVALTSCGGGGSESRSGTTDSGVADASGGNDASEAADGGEAADESSGSAVRVMPAPGDLTAEALAAVLLVVEEVGGGYALDHEDLGDAPASEENRVGDDVEPATEGECAGLELERAYVDGLAVWRRFLGAGEAEVEHVVTPVRADEVGELDDVLAGLDCRLEVDDGESAGTVRYSTGEVSGVGQAAYWLEVDWDMTEPVSFTAQQYAVVSLRDGIASAVWVQGPLDLTGSGTGFTRSGPDRDLARRLAVVADNKIEALES